MSCSSPRAPQTVRCNAWLAVAVLAPITLASPLAIFARSDAAPPLAPLAYFVGTWSCTAEGRAQPATWHVRYERGGSMLDMAITGHSDEGLPLSLDVQIVANGPNHDLYSTARSTSQGAETDRLHFVGSTLVFDSQQTSDGSKGQRKFRPLGHAAFVDEATYVESDGDVRAFSERCVRTTPGRAS